MTACGTDAPVDVVTQEAGVEQERLDPFWITVDADGTVHVEGARHPIEQLSEVVGPRNVAAGGKLVVRLLAPKDLPYDLIARAQEELMAANVRRVLFGYSETRSPDDDEVAMLLPGLGEGLPRTVSQRNLLHLIVQPDGLIDVKRGESVQVQRVWPGQVGGLWRQEVLSNPDLIAAVKIHPEASHEQMIAIMSALESLDAQWVSLQELEL
jgi:biopolymer transport protein ExbD